MNQIVKRTLLAASVAAAVGMVSNAHATNGYELIGVGAYQMGMAGAVVSAPGSAMTAITNPAGIAAIAPQADFSLEAFMPKRHVNFSGSGGAKQNSGANLYGIPAIGWSAPISEGSNIYFGGGMYGTSGLGVDYPYTANGGPAGQSFTGFGSFSILQIAPSVAMKVNDKLTVGAALNIGYMATAFQQNYGFAAAQQGGQTYYGSYGVNLSRTASAFGAGVTLGVLYKINPMWTVGAAYTSSQRYKLNYDLSPGDISVPSSTNPRAPSSYGYPAGKYTLIMKTPQVAAVGVTVHPTSALSVSGQIKYIGWHEVMNNLSITGPMSFNGFTPHWKNQTVYAVAANYQVNPALQVRGGFNYGKSPIDSSSVQYNVILPAVVEQHYTAGFSYQLNKHWKIGGAYMYAPKKTFTAPASAGSTKIDLGEQAVSFNVGYKF